jgi:hypothetical protein
MMNSKTIIVSMIAAVIAVVGVVGLSNQAQAAVSKYAYVGTSGVHTNTSGVYVYPNNGQRPPQTNRVKVTPFKDFWKVLKYTR